MINNCYGMTNTINVKRVGVNPNMFLFISKQMKNNRPNKKKNMIYRYGSLSQNNELSITDRM